MANGCSSVTLTSFVDLEEGLSRAETRARVDRELDRMVRELHTKYKRSGAAVRNVKEKLEKRPGGVLVTVTAEIIGL